MSETTKQKRSKQIPTAEFLPRYLELQQEGKSAEEIAKAFGMKETSFRTKVSNAALELEVATMFFPGDSEDDDPIDGQTFANNFLPTLRKQRTTEALAEYEKAVKAHKDNPTNETAEAVEKADAAVNRANTLSALDSMRAVREMVNEGQLEIINADDVFHLPMPAGGREQRDLAGLAALAKSIVSKSNS